MLKHFLQPSGNAVSDSMGRMNRQMEEANTEEQAKLVGLPYVNLHAFPADINTLSIFSEVDAKNAESVVFSKDKEVLRIATRNPNNVLLKEKLKELENKYKTKLYIVSKSGLDYAMTFYKYVVSPHAHVDEEVRLDPNKDYVAFLNQLKDVQQQRALNITELIGSLFGVAMRLSASDIHFEPEDHIVKIRYRVDGVLQDLLHLDKSIQNTAVSRVKILSKLKLNVENLPQDGRITFMWGTDPIDVRVSSLPTAYGEGLVLRLLGVGAVKLKLNDLGLTGRSYKIIETELGKPNGMIVTTGPTGSGKTTTLYAFLNELNEPGVKIITIEDPVEYKLEGISQTPIDHNVDFSFAKALRSILRQDPDIVMVGEIRDTETAETALQAALTGHIVLSTLHTNDSFGAVPRLVTMGAKPFIIAPAINAVIAQRLVRRLCEKCKVVYVPDSTLIARVEAILKTIPATAEVATPSTKQFYHAPGCGECHNLGYKGRIGIYEVVHVNDAMKDLILKGASMLDMKAQAMKDGTITMVQDGMLKVLAGVTDIEEVFRVAGE